MKRISPKQMTVDQLLARFAAIGIDQDKALLRNETAKFNRLYDEMDAIGNELEARDGDQRRALVALYDHPNAQVRLNAIKATLAVSPEQARWMLKVMADSRDYPQALDTGDAGMTLINLERGIFKPT